MVLAGGGGLTEGGGDGPASPHPAGDVTTLKAGERLPKGCRKAAERPCRRRQCRRRTTTCIADIADIDALRRERGFGAATIGWLRQLHASGECDYLATLRLRGSSASSNGRAVT